MHGLPGIFHPAAFRCRYRLYQMSYIVPVLHEGCLSEKACPPQLNFKDGCRQVFPVRPAQVIQILSLQEVNNDGYAARSSVRVYHGFFQDTEDVCKIQFPVKKSNNFFFRRCLNINRYRKMPLPVSGAVVLLQHFTNESVLCHCERSEAICLCKNGYFA